ncbi:MAG: MMPL family transporter [Bacteroidia bacterium]|nr:MMPL family transporter [Bacteroidia bacterium]
MRSWPDFLLRGRYMWLGLVAMGSIYMLWRAQGVEITQDFIKVVPEDDADYQLYRRFRKEFGEDAGLVLVGITLPPVAADAYWARLRSLSDTLGAIPGVQGVFGLPTAPVLRWTEEGFHTEPLSLPKNSQEWDSLRRRLPLYEGFLWDRNGESLLFFIQIDSLSLHTRAKHALIDRVEKIVRRWAEPLGVQVHFSGVPYLRHYVAQLLPEELWFFTVGSLVLTVVALLLYFRSWYAAAFPVVLLGLASLWTVGIIGIYGYKITLLTALLPSVIIILGIPPSIYMLSEYHRLYVAKGNKLSAIREMLRQLGLVTFMIHGNTALGFLTLYLTNVVPLQEFGLVAFWGTITTYFLTILLLPSFFMLLPEPKERHLRHLTNRWVVRWVHWVGAVVERRRGWVYGISLVLFGVAIGGILRLKAVSYMADDLPSSAQVMRDQAFFAARYGGTMPFEIVIEASQPQGVRRLRVLKALSALQDSLSRYPELARSISIADLLKAARQAFWGGVPQAYGLPQPEELPTLLRATRQGGSLQLLGTLVDSTYQRTRITAFVQDVGSMEMPLLLERVREDIRTTFGEEAGRVYITGTTLIFLKAISYLVDNLVWSLVATFLLVAFQMFLLYGSFRIMLISMGVNLLPLFLVAGLMGYMGMPVKPSTALIYEMAFGIVVDSAIHFLSSYQWYYRRHPRPSRAAVVSVHHTGALIAYTSFVLLMGFGIFAFSSFGGTRALGILTALSLGIGLFSNLFLLPSLVISFRQADKGAVGRFIQQVRRQSPERPAQQDHRGGDMQ